MGEVSDEVLMAYVDGELDEGTAGVVAAALADDADLRARAERFRATRLPVQAAFDGVLAEPVPPALLALARGGPATAAAAASRPAPVASLSGVAGKGRGRPAWIAPLRMAAGVASLLLAGVAGWLLNAGSGPQSSPRELPVRVAERLQQLLETAPSGTRLAVVDAGKVDDAVFAVSTFRGPSDRFCRQFGIALGTDTFEGIACRTSRGWVTEHQMRRAQTAGRVKGLEPAWKKPRDALDQSIDALVTGGPLDAHEEQLLLGSRWTAPLPKR